VWRPLAEQLRRELRTRFGSVRKASIHAALHYQQVMQWLSMRHVPEAKGLRRLLEASGVPLEPYTPVLQPLYVPTVCPGHDCGRQGRMRRSEIVKRQNRVPGRKPFVQRDDGRLEVLCRRHTLGLRRTLYTRREQRLCAVFGAKKGLAMAEELKRSNPEPDAVAMWRRVACAWLLPASIRGEIFVELKKSAPNLAAVDSKIRITQSNLFRGRRGRPRRTAALPAPTIKSVLSRFLSKPVHICPLCELAIYARRDDLRWHRPCLLAWEAWTGHEASVEVNWPPPTRARGPSREKDLRRNLRWLLIQRAHARSRRELAAEAGVVEAAVRLGARAALRLLPGRWDVFYARGNDDQGNRTRQQYLALPDDGEFRAMIDDGERDPLIRRLQGLGMPISDIDAITGAGVARIRGVVAAMPAPAVSA
jgi:hypothetical protein